jgi:hypothetical protein
VVGERGELGVAPDDDGAEHVPARGTGHLRYNQPLRRNCTYSDASSTSMIARQMK